MISTILVAAEIGNCDGIRYLISYEIIGSAARGGFKCSRIHLKMISADISPISKENFTLRNTFDYRRMRRFGKNFISLILL